MVGFANFTIRSTRKFKPLLVARLTRALCGFTMTMMCHVYLLELPDEMAIVFMGDSVPESVLKKHGEDGIVNAPRHHFTAALPSDTIFPTDEITRDAAQQWFDNLTDKHDVVFHRHKD